MTNSQENMDIMELNTTLSSTPVAKPHNRPLPQVDKDWFFGGSQFGQSQEVQDIPVDISEQLKKIAPRTLQYLQSSMYHDIRNAFNKTIQDYVEKEFESMATMFMEAKMNSLCLTRNESTLDSLPLLNTTTTNQRKSERDQSEIK